MTNSILNILSLNIMSGPIILSNSSIFIYIYTAQQRITIIMVSDVYTLIPGLAAPRGGD